MSSKRCFTLLEVMVVLAIILIAAAALGGWRTYRMVERKRFQSDSARLHDRLLTCHRLALNMQSDWEGILEKKGKHWIFTARCIDQPTVQGLPPLKLHAFSIAFDDKPQEQWIVAFSATGEISPSGTLSLRMSGKKEEWEIPSMFQKETGKKLGPLHPSLLPL